MSTDTASPRRRGRPPRAAQTPQSVPQAPTATHIADQVQKAPQSRTEAVVSLDPSAIMTKQLHTWLSSLSRGSAHDRN